MKQGIFKKISLLFLIVVLSSEILSQSNEEKAWTAEEIEGDFIICEV